MSGSNHRHRHKKMNGKSFIILPIIFLVGIYLIIYLAGVPTVGPLVSATGMLFSDTPKDYSTEFKNIFTPVADDESVPTVSKEDGKTYVDKKEVVYPNYGNQFGQIVIEDCGIDCPLFFGDDNIALNNGVGIYNGSFIPGYGKTILVAGHNNTYFNGLKNAAKNQEITLRTSYGNYTYKITDTAIKKATDGSAFDLSADYENLVLYTCYPFDEIGLTEYRFFVYAEPISGTPIDNSTKQGE